MTLNLNRVSLDKGILTKFSSVKLVVIFCSSIKFNRLNLRFKPFLVIVKFAKSKAKTRRIEILNRNLADAQNVFRALLNSALEL